MLTDIQRGLILQSKAFIKEVLLEKLNCYFGNVLNLLKRQKLTLVYSLDTSSASMSVSITGKFVQSSPLQTYTLVHSYDMCTSLSYIPIYSHSERTESIWMLLVVNQLSLPTVAHHFLSSPIPLALDWYFPSKHLFGKRLLNSGNVLLLTLVGGISLPLPLNLILLSHKIACSGFCSGHLAQIHCKLEHLLLP